MFASLKVRRFRSGLWRRPGKARSVFAIALVSAFLAIPALAYAAKGTTARADLAGLGGYCQYYDAAAAAVGKVQIATSPAASPGFHSVRVDIKIRAGQVLAGSYQVWLVNLYRDEAGQVIGCAASPFATPMTVTSGSPIAFRGSVDRYSGEYELQVYVGPIWGPGYATSPAIVDVP
jgi:hypothetical protein